MEKSPLPAAIATVPSARQWRARWLEQREAELLPVPYFHVVFTLPAWIARLALQNPKQIYTILTPTDPAR